MFMELEKTKLDDVALLSELLGLIGEELWVHTYYESFGGGMGFVARLDRVEPVNWELRELHLSFNAAKASANLACSRMTAWRVLNPLTDNYWLEFTIADRRVVQIHRIPSLRRSE